MPIQYNSNVLRRMNFYLLREVFGLFCLGVVAVCLLLSVDFLVVFSRFLVQQDVNLHSVALLLKFKVPWFLHLALPVAVVLSVLIATGRLAKDSELKAAYLLGISPTYFLLGLFLFGLFVSALALLNNGWLEPNAERSYRALVDSFFYSQPPQETRFNVAYALKDDGIFYASRVRRSQYEPQSANLDGILVLLNDGRAISAKQGIWRSIDQTWELKEPLVYLSGRKMAITDSMVIPFSLNSDPSTTLSKSETLTLGQLNRQLRDINNAGGVTRDIRFQLHRRLADASSAVVFVAVSSALGLHHRRRLASLAWAIILLLGFWAIWTLSGDLHSRGLGSSIVLAWLTPGIVALLGIPLALSRLRT